MIARILCVHESGTVLRELRHLMESEGFGVITANDGRAAMEVLSCGGIAGIMMGANLAAPNGRLLRNEIWHRYPELPLLMFSDVEEVVHMPFEVFREYLKHPGPPAAVLVGV